MPEPTQPQAPAKAVEYVQIQSPQWENNLSTPELRAQYPFGAYVAVARSEAGDKVASVVPFPAKEGDEREIQFQMQDQERVRQGKAECQKALVSAVKAAGGKLVAGVR